MENLWLSPPLAGGFFLLLVTLLYRVSGRLNTGGSVHPGKHLPYTGGEPPGPLPEGLGYHAFFRLALLYGVLHVATLVISTLPQGVLPHRSAVLYLAAMGVSVLVLTGRED